MHEGHRQRMFERLKSGSKLEDHELLEILLFFPLPRVNTNEIAHSLIDSFGDLASVFRADVKQLEEVNGIGPKAAHYLNTVGQIMDRAGFFPTENVPHASNYLTFADFLKRRYMHEPSEIAEIFVVEKNGQVVFSRRFTSDEIFAVQINSEELTSFVATFHPKQVILVHNHVKGTCRPSKEDDEMTRRLYLFFDMCGVKLLDHYIVSEKNVYSYEHENRMREISESCNSDAVFKRISS